MTPSFSFSGLENRITKKTHFWQSFLGHPTRSVYTVLIFIDLVMVLRIKTQSNRRQPLWIFANVLCYIRCMLLMILFDRFRLSSLLYFFVFSFCFIFFSFLFFFSKRCVIGNMRNYIDNKLVIPRNNKMLLCTHCWPPT